MDLFDVDRSLAGDVPDDVRHRQARRDLRRFDLHLSENAVAVLVGDDRREEESGAEREQDAIRRLHATWERRSAETPAARRAGTSRLQAVVEAVSPKRFLRNRHHELETSHLAGRHIRFRRRSLQLRLRARLPFGRDGERDVARRAPVVLDAYAEDMLFASTLCAERDMESEEVVDLVVGELRSQDVWQACFDGRLRRVHDTSSFDRRASRSAGVVTPSRPG